MSLILDFKKNSMFLKNVKILMKYPDMYLQTNTLIEATSFVAGMDMNSNQPIGDGFRVWLVDNKIRDKSSSFGWPKNVELYMIENNVPNDKQVSVFFEILDDFLGKKYQLEQ